MSEYQIDSALGHYVVVEPYEKSTVLKANEISTIFRVISLGLLVETYNNNNQWYNNIKIDDLIIVASNTIEKTRMGNQEVYYVHEQNIIARIKKFDDVTEKKP